MSASAAAHAAASLSGGEEHAVWTLLMGAGSVGTAVYTLYVLSVALFVRVSSHAPSPAGPPLNPLGFLMVVLCSTGGGSTNAVLVGKIPFVLQSDYVMAACLLAYLAVFASPGDIVFRILSWKPLSIVHNTCVGLYMGWGIILGVDLFKNSVPLYCHLPATLFGVLGAVGGGMWLSLVRFVAGYKHHPSPLTQPNWVFWVVVSLAGGYAVHQGDIPIASAKLQALLPGHEYKYLAVIALGLAMLVVSSLPAKGPTPGKGTLEKQQDKSKKD